MPAPFCQYVFPISENRERSLGKRERNDSADLQIGVYGAREHEEHEEHEGLCP